MRTMADINKDGLDRIVDAALAKYGAGEPRVGLETRVLANLRAECSRVPERAWWRWSVAGLAAAIIIVIAALALRSGKPSHPVVAKNAPTTAPVEVPPGTPGGREIRNRRPPFTHTPAKHVTHCPSTLLVAAGPKLEQFPSPQPLSEQEFALTRYVNEFPQEATLIARAQYEYETEIQQKMKDAISETISSDSDQRER